MRAVVDAPKAVLDDGLFDVLIAPAITILQLAGLVPQVLLGRHMDNELLLFRRATRIEIECDPPMAFNVDCELIGEGTARFEILPRALRVTPAPPFQRGGGRRLKDPFIASAALHRKSHSPSGR